MEFLLGVIPDVACPPRHINHIKTQSKRELDFHFVARLWSYVEKKRLIKKFDPNGRLAPKRALQKRITEIRF